MSESRTQQSFANYFTAFPNQTRYLQDSLVLPIQRQAVAFRLSCDLKLDARRIFLESDDLSDEFVGVDVLDVLAIFSQPHAVHQRLELFVIRNSEDRLPEHRCQQEVVKPT